MKRKVVKLLSLNIILFAFVIGIYAIGYEYDKSNKVHPEMYYFSDAGITVYGKRWERFSKFVISTVVIDVVAITIFIYTEPTKERKRF